MRLKSFALAAAALGLMGALSLPVKADDAKAVIEARQKIMKDQGAQMKAIGAWMKGESKESAADIAGRGATLAADAKKIPAAFKENYSLANTKGVETRAKPEIWTEWNKFVELANKLEKDAAALAAAGTDEAKLKAAAGEVGKDCGACHKEFQAKKS